MERVQRKRRESEGDGWCEGRVTEEGIAFVPLPPLNPRRAPCCVTRAPPAELSVAWPTNSRGGEAQRRGVINAGAVAGFIMI